MNARERGFLLLTDSLGNPQRRPLTVPQLRNLANRLAESALPLTDRDLCPEDLAALGYAPEMAQHMAELLAEEAELTAYLRAAQSVGCIPLTRVSEDYPLQLRKRLGLDSPGVLWAKGNIELLRYKSLALVGSREITPENAAFAQEVGRQAALQGYVLVSGNARGADRLAQDACLSSGGAVVSVVADRLYLQQPAQDILYLSEGGYNETFSIARAISRNRVIHGLAEAAFVAQSDSGFGGTWDGTVKNLRFGWSRVFCNDNGSEAMVRLCAMGANCVTMDELADLDGLLAASISLI